ncbi:uncharacterized protein [Choristoneura fumiferana]|uniref:uncharacterized protein n=1 Tax=Choristoneura fumiferana TaxID=7141 RepID=UPI003D15C8B7
MIAALDGSVIGLLIVNKLECREQTAACNRLYNNTPRNASRHAATARVRGGLTGGRRPAAASDRYHAIRAPCRPPPPPRRPRRPRRPAPPHSLLDPKFSRALDFKLRRLKEKEVLQANLRRPTRRARAAPLAGSMPCLAAPEPAIMTRSQPRVDLAPEAADASPSPGRGSRGRARRAASPGDAPRPRFVTTVKVGQFLPPPPQLAELLGLDSLYPAPAPPPERLVYSYASRPLAVAPRAKRPAEPRTDPGGAEPRAEPGGAKRAHVASVFGGVRALVAGVAGMRHMLEESTYVGDAPVIVGSLIAARHARTLTDF